MLNTSNNLKKQNKKITSPTADNKASCEICGHIFPCRIYYARIVKGPTGTLPGMCNLCEVNRNNIYKTGVLNSNDMRK